MYIYTSEVPGNYIAGAYVHVCVYAYANVYMCVCLRICLCLDPVITLPELLLCHICVWKSWYVVIIELL